MRVLAMLLGCAAVLCAQPSSFEGAWSGTLDAGALKLRIGLNVSCRRLSTVPTRERSASRSIPSPSMQTGFDSQSSR